MEINIPFSFKHKVNIAKLLVYFFYNRQLSGNRSVRFAYLNYVRLCLRPQSTHRVAIADLWRISYPDGKINPGWWGGGGHAHPLFSL